MKSAIAVLALALFSAVGAQAQDQLKASDLQTLCESNDRITVGIAANDFTHVKPTDWQDAEMCLGYLTGVMDAEVGSTFIHAGVVYTVVVSKAVSGKEAAKLFMRYIVAHPEDLSDRAWVPVSIALSQAGIFKKMATGQTIK